LGDPVVVCEEPTSSFWRTKMSGPVYDGEPVAKERVVVKTREVVKSGVSLGSALAIAISWSVNKSILWAIIHGILSWIYVIYYALTR
jgi:hypothetical protein